MLEILADRTVRACRSFPRPALLAFALLASCQALNDGPTPVFGDRTEMLAPDRLASVQPGDIAVLPVHNQTELEDLPVEALREAFHDGLVDRLYSPLDLAFVDAHWTESSFRGETPPDAVLVVSLNHWSTGALSGHGILEVGAELRLFQGGTSAGPLLWSAQIDREVRVITGHPPYGPSEELIARGIEEYARQALAVLPERDPLAAHR